MKPMLALEDTPKKTAKMAAHPDWWMQQKLDGQRVLIRVFNGAVEALNRHGDPKVTMVTRALLAHFERFPEGEWFFDGELMPDGTLWLFDLVIPGTVDAADPYSFRLSVLESLCSRWAMPDTVRLLYTARDSAQKARLVDAVESLDGEGWVVKHKSHPYLPGDRSSQVLKMKRWHSADVIIRDTNIDGKDNAELELYPPDNRMHTMSVGRCSLLGKPDVKKGDVVEVKYLYAGANNRLVQPSLLRVRDDKDPMECDTMQLSYVNKEVARLG